MTNPPPLALDKIQTAADHLAELVEMRQLDNGEKLLRIMLIRHWLEEFAREINDIEYRLKRDLAARRRQR